MRRLTGREKRLLVYLAVLLAVVGWDTARRHWSPDVTVETDHYIIYSTATLQQSEEIGAVAEMLYREYMSFFDRLGIVVGSHPKLKVKLFRDRKEFRSCNRVRGWAEAFYRKPYCYQYYSASEVNPYHWMIHEATHQLTAEVANLSLAKWLDEGIAAYFSTSRIISNRLCLGQIDTNTYPVWWLHELATCGDLETDKANLSIIPLRAIVAGEGGPDMDDYFNLYYLHWWSLTHFLLHDEDGKHRPGVARLLDARCDIAAFERHVGEVSRIERQWYAYVLKLKKELSGRATPPVIILQEDRKPK